MKKLEDLPKKQFFEAPEGYFDKLPSLIQARISHEKSEPFWTPYIRFSLRYAVPVLAIAAVFFFWPKPGESAEDLLASVDSASLVSFLEDSDISTDDLLDIVSLHGEEIDAIQENTMDEMNLNEVDIDHLEKEFNSDF